MLVDSYIYICIDTLTYRRAKDTGTPTGDWMADLVDENPWFKDLLPNVLHPLPKQRLICMKYPIDAKLTRAPVPRIKKRRAA